MAGSLSFLNNLPCPSEDSERRCTNPQCQFKHGHAIQMPGQRARPSHDGVNHREDQDGPRKRQRISEDREGPAAYDPAVVETAVATPSPKSKEPTPSDKRPISPPPVKRKISTAAKVDNPEPTAKSSTSTAISVTEVSMARPLPVEKCATTPGVKKPVPKVQPKAESLNPRHIEAGAPASHAERVKLVKALHEQFVRLNGELKKDANEDEEKLILSNQELIRLALDGEEMVAREKPKIYANIIRSKIMTYKRMTVAAWKQGRLTDFKKEAAASMQKTRPKVPLGEPRVIDTGLSPELEVQVLAHLQTPIDDLSQHGYVPRAPTEEEIRKTRAAEEMSKGWEVCDRCKTRFQVFPGRREEDGALASGGKCTYHWGRTYFPESRSGGEKRYRCCGTAVGDTPGCVQAETHVFKTTDPKRLACVVPFVETPPNLLAPKDRAVAFDCEMGYTVRGLELIRLTATSWPTGEELLDVLVQPIGEVLDLNSRYSGVWPADMVDAEPWSASSLSQPPLGLSSITPTPDGNPPPRKKKLPIVSSPIVARDLLFSLIAPDTPLIGHGLENDLNATRVVHPFLVDTALLYPHRRGLPFRNGLRALAETHLGRRIQAETDAEGAMAGHDSAEDARAAGDLVRVRVGQEWEKMKAQGWSLANGKLVAPVVKIVVGGGGRQNGLLTEEFLEREVGEVEE